MFDTRRRFRARWVFPAADPPLEAAWVEVSGNKIHDISQAPADNVQDLGNVALLPALINSHTHLEFSDLSHPLQPATPFTDWIGAVVRYRRERTGSSVPATIQGLAESRSSGVGVVGDIVTTGWSPRPYQRSGLKTVAFRELIGLLPQQWPLQISVAQAHLGNLDRDEERKPGQPPSVRQTYSDPALLRGLSPHAPYSVHPELLQQLTRLAASANVPVAMHLAETAAEIEFITQHTGPFRQMLEQFGLWQPDLFPTGLKLADYVKWLAEAPRGLVIHGNFLDEAAIAELQTADHLSVVYCPRTHAYFRHAPHPWRNLLECGIRVVLGTDGRTSNPDLHLFREMQFLHRQFPSADGHRILQMGTCDAAAALGLDTEFGRLAPDGSACIAVIQLPDRDDTDPYSLLFDPASSPRGLLSDAQR